MQQQEEHRKQNGNQGAAMRSAFERYGGWLIPIIITIATLLFNAGGDRQLALATAHSALEETKAIRSEIDSKYARRENVEALKEIVQQRLDQSDRKLDETKDELRRLRTSIEMMGRR